MQSLSPKNLLSLLVAAACAAPLAVLLTRTGPDAIIALLTTTVTVLLIQVAYLRRDLSNLKDQVLEKS